MQLLENLKWRYATKIFEPNRKIEPRDLNYLKEAIQLSVSSYGLQLYKVLIIEDPELRLKLKAASYDQDQITDASKLIVFCHYTEVTDELVDSFIERTATARGKTYSEVKGYGDFIKRQLNAKNPEQLRQWVAKQTYLAMGNLLTACAELRIDACPMEGFEPELYDEILELRKENLQSSLIVPIGYRSHKDESQHFKKVRRPESELFELVKKGTENLNPI